MERRWVVRTGSDLGAAIGEVRRQRGLTQAQVAQASGLSRSWLAKIERGKSGLLLDHVLRVLTRLGATVVVEFDASASDRA
jgi:HTH-type transcriptional regulator/antitoxin HipB